MLALTAGHSVLLLSMSAGLALGIGIALLVLRANPRPVPEQQLPAALLAALAAIGPRHLLDQTAVHAGDYMPRHAAVYLPLHEIAHDTAVELGHHVDGDVALVRAYVLKEPTFAVMGA